MLRAFARSCQHAIEANQVIHGRLPLSVPQPQQVMLPVAWQTILLLKELGKFREPPADGKFLARTAQPELDEFAVAGQIRWRLEPRLATLNVNAVELLIGLGQIHDAFNDANNGYND